GRCIDECRASLRSGIRLAGTHERVLTGTRRDERDYESHRTRRECESMRRLAIGLLLLCATAAGAATIHNDDSCDISVMPAATLLLPYFEVDINSPQTVARTTIFTVVNTS